MGNGVASLRQRGIWTSTVLLFGLVLAQGAHGRQAAPIIVTTTTDGGSGSLRQAILDANTAPGLDSISFNIPGSPPYTIVLGGPLPEVTEPLIIDGTTQPGFSGSPIVELDATAAAFKNCLTISGGGCTVRGLVINRHYYYGIELKGGGSNVIEGNYIGTNVPGTSKLGNSAAAVQITDSSFNIVGGATTSARNVLRGNWQAVGIQGATSKGNVIAGNYIGIGSDGDTGLNNLGHGVYIRDSSSNTVGGAVAGAGNVIGGGGIYGIFLSGTSDTVIQGNRIGTNAAGTSAQGYNTGIYFHPANSTLVGGSTPAARNLISGNGVGITVEGTGNVVQGNYIGTDVTGTVALGNISRGIDGNSQNTTIGGSSPGQGNLISGNGDVGILLPGTPGATIQGNLIGTKANGTDPLGNGGHGVQIINSSNKVGGTASGAGNVIAFNQGDGVRIEAGTGNLVSSNSIHSNGQLGINLGTDGVTPNDAGDVDIGVNGLQNFPVLDSVLSNNLTTTVRGSLESQPGASFRLEFFSSPLPNPSSYGEGRSFLGFTNVTTAGDGRVTFEVSLPVAVPANQYVSCTATDPSDNTSEFSQAIVSIFDVSAPTVTINQAVGQADPTNGGPIHFTVVFSEAVAGFDAPDITLSGNAGATTVVVTGGPTTYDVAVSGMTGSGTVSAAVPAGIATDAANNPNAASVSVDSMVFYDIDQPIVVNVTSSSPDGTYGSQQSISIIVTFSESVLVTGAPMLVLETGVVDAEAVYGSGSGTAALTFNYKVSPGQSSADLDYVSSGALLLNGATITDLAGNDAIVGLPTPGTTGSLGANSNIVIDAPPISGKRGGRCGMIGLEALVILAILRSCRR